MVGRSQVGPNDPAKQEAPLSLPEILETTVYDIVPSRELPTFDPSITIKKMLVPRTGLVRLNRFFKRYAIVIGLSYGLGLVCRSATVAVPVKYGQWTALATLPLQVCAVFNVMMQFRIAFIKLLVLTYDFWYYFTMNSVWAICLAWYLCDWRIVIVPIMWIDVQNATLLDAFFQDFHVLISAAWLWCIGLCCVIAAVALDAVEGVNGDHVVLALRQRVLTVKEVLLNAIATVLLLIARMVYRKRAAMWAHKKNGHSARTVHSITLTWPVKLQPRPSPSSPGWQVQRQIFHPTKLQLQLTLKSKPLKASNVLIPSILMSLRSIVRIRYAVRGVGMVGLGTTVVAICLPPSNAHRLALAWVSMTCTTLYSLVVLCFYHSRLLTQVVWSFDFVFTSLTITVVHVCIADVFRWETAPLLCLGSCWIWLHLVMTFDAVTPAIRRILGFCCWVEVPVLLLAFLAAILLWLELSIWDSLHLYNRCFFDIQFGRHRFQLYVVPCLLSRLLTMCLWAGRTLYRIIMRTSDHDLLFIRSHVEFDGLFHQRKPVKWSIQTRLKSSLLRRTLQMTVNPESTRSVSLASVKNDNVGT